MTKNAYLYIHQFEWNDEIGSEMFHGEPKKGRVYYAEDLGDMYQVTVAPTQSYAGVTIKKSHLVDSSHEAWDCDVEVVTIYNLLELDISNKDLKMMADGELEESEEATTETRNNQLLDDLGESLNELRAYDNDAYEAMVMITTIMAESVLKPRYISLTEGLEQDLRTAKTTNVAIIASELESYINEPDPFEMSYLLNAVRQILIETIRLHKLNKLNA